MSLRSGKLPFLGSEDELFDHTGLTITLAGVGIGTALPKELFSDAELRRALSRLGYESEWITDILEALTANKVSWKQTRDFDESAVAALGF